MCECKPIVIVLQIKYYSSRMTYVCMCTITILLSIIPSGDDCTVISYFFDVHSNAVSHVSKFLLIDTLSLLMFSVIINSCATV